MRSATDSATDAAGGAAATRRVLARTDRLIALLAAVATGPAPALSDDAPRHTRVPLGEAVNIRARLAARQRPGVVQREYDLSDRTLSNLALGVQLDPRRAPVRRAA